MSDMAKETKSGTGGCGQMMLFEKWTEGSSGRLPWPRDARSWAVRDVGARQVIFRQGGKPECLFEIINGMLKLSQVTEDGRQIILGFPTAGQLVGLTGGKEYRYAAETVTPTRLRLLRWTVFYRQLLQERPAREKLLRWIDAQEEMTHDHIAMLALQSPLSKLATFLLSYISQQKKSTGSESATVNLPMTQRDIANYLQIAPETCSRMMKKLRDDGIIAARDRSGDGQLLKILDRKRLSDFAIAGSP